ncbi:nicotinate-nucleotide adenylyltransferase [Massilibacterium senegalense]|uniref:nicotinate-nucleotide adenylyltransferase n=1 Tax=Massilibacterium senegalense TaxID=1632858 RepID=UPI0007864167
MRKIGILGGTFDPPHLGHLIIAEEVREQCKLDEIWFMPNQSPPHKQINPFIQNEHRIEMVKRSIKGHPQFHISLIEFERSDVSYTYDTMIQIKKRYPDDDFYFIIGGDMVEYLPKWHKIDELLQMITFIGAKRPGYDMSCPYPNHVIEVEVPQIDISSSMVRERIHQQKSIRYLVMDEVRVYIEENDLYG